MSPYEKFVLETTSNHISSHGHVSLAHCKTIMAKASARTMGKTPRRLASKLHPLAQHDAREAQA